MKKLLQKGWIQKYIIVFISTIIGGCIDFTVSELHHGTMNGLLFTTWATITSILFVWIIPYVRKTFIAGSRGMNLINWIVLLVVFSLIILINAIGHRTSFRYDMTQDQRYSL